MLAVQQSRARQGAVKSPSHRENDRSQPHPRGRGSVQLKGPTQCAGGLSPCQRLLKLINLQRAEDVAWFEPAPPRHEHAVLHILEMADVMGVG